MAAIIELVAQGIQNQHFNFPKEAYHLFDQKTYQINTTGLYSFTLDRVDQIKELIIRLDVPSLPTLHSWKRFLPFKMIKEVVLRVGSSNVLYLPGDLLQVHYFMDPLEAAFDYQREERKKKSKIPNHLMIVIDLENIMGRFNYISQQMGDCDAIVDIVIDYPQEWIDVEYAIDLKCVENSTILPPEIWNDIFQYMDINTWTNCRQSCRFLYQLHNRREISSKIMESYMLEKKMEISLSFRGVYLDGNPRQICAQGNIYNWCHLPSSSVYYSREQYQGLLQFDLKTGGRMILWISNGIEMDNKINGIKCLNNDKELSIEITDFPVNNLYYLCVEDCDEEKLVDITLELDVELDRGDKLWIFSYLLTKEVTFVDTKIDILTNYH